MSEKLAEAVWRVLAKAHELRNAAEYGGRFDVDALLLKNLVEAAEAVRIAIASLPAVPDN